MMIPEEDYCDDYGINPYESFMKRHLQHYGYYTGKNQSYKNQFQQYAEWEKNYSYNLSNSSSSDGSDSDSDDDKNGDNKKEEDPRTTQLVYSYGESGKMVPKLREPRSLYALNKELGPQQAARWPSDLQVLNERIKHIQTTPSEPEPFYRQTGMEKCPMVRGEANGGRVVYNYETNSSFFMKSRVGGSRSGCERCAVGLESEDDKTLIFESRFESGNLGKAVQIGEFEYELWLRYDLYTNKHTQWFYFRVSNTRADQEYRFTVVNLMKPDSLYNSGMRPVMYSEKEAAKNKVGWRRGGNNIKYYRNNVRYEHGKGEPYFYSVTWTHKMQHDNDTVYFSHCYPYTYTDLQDYLLDITNDPIKSRICKQRVLCRTLAGNLVYVLTITSSSQNPEDMKHKKAVVVTSRVHPGESNSSWMMKGFLDFVTGNSPDAKLLRDTFIFKVVPMLNPDGVVVGNYRCSLAGRDLNRNYKTALKDAYPSVWHTKSLIRKLLMERNIIVYCDLHGHSRRQNVFIYGCEQHPTYGCSNFSGTTNNNNRKFHERVFPSMLSKNSPEKFCFKSCKFKVQKSKEGTGRVVVWNMGVQNSYTMEATFCGSSLGKKKGLHFNQHDFEMMGYHFCDTLLDYCDPDNTKYTKILVDLEDKHKMEVITKIAQKGLQPDAVEIMDTVSTDTESSTGGSDSEVSDGPPVHLQFAAARVLNDPKKKKLKSKRDRDKARKEDLKKVATQQEEKRLRNNQVKPLKPENGGKVASQSIRYTSTSPKRPRSFDDRSNTGVPVFVQERFEEKQQKRNDYLEALTAAYISNNIPIVNDPAEQPEPETPSYIRDLDLRRLTPKWLQEAAFRMYPLSHVQRGDSAFKISRLVAKREDRQQSQSNMEDLLRAHLSQPSSVISLERRPKPHLLEVSAAQQRQQDALSRDKNGQVKAHPNPFDETSRKDEQHKANAPASTSYVSYETFNVAQIPQQANNGDAEDDKELRKNSHRDKERGGRKSRKGMREDDDESQLGYQPRIQSAAGDIFGGTGPTTHPPRVKSAHSTPGMATALSSIQEIQRSLTGTGGEGGSTSSVLEANATGDYIQKLIKETNEEIQDLTHEIQEDIEKRQHFSKVKDEASKNRRFASQLNQQEKKQQHKDREKEREKKEKQEKEKQQKQQDHNNLKSESRHNNNYPSNPISGRSLLGLNYHGSTFINDLSKIGEVTSSGSIRGVGSGGGPNLGSPAPTSAKPSNTHLSYSGSSVASVDPTRLMGGPNLIVAGGSSSNSKHKRSHQQQQTSIEEEARKRSLKRQASLHNQTTSQGIPPNLDTSHTPINDASNIESLSTPFRQISTSSYQSNGSNYAHTPSSGLRLNKHNLVLKVDTSSTNNLHQSGSTPCNGANNEDCDESGGEKRCQQKYH